MSSAEKGRIIHNLMMKESVKKFLVSGLKQAAMACLFSTWRFALKLASR